MVTAKVTVQVYGETPSVVLVVDGEIGLNGIVVVVVGTQPGSQPSVSGCPTALFRHISESLAVTVPDELTSQMQAQD